MIKKLAWNTFKKTGDINTYLEFVETENIEKQIEKDGEKNGKIDIGKNVKWEQ